MMRLERISKYILDSANCEKNYCEIKHFAEKLVKLVESCRLIGPFDNIPHTLYQQELLKILINVIPLLNNTEDYIKSHFCSCLLLNFESMIELPQKWKKLFTTNSNSKLMDNEKFSCGAEINLFGPTLLEISIKVFSTHHTSSLNTVINIVVNLSSDYKRYKKGSKGFHQSQFNNETDHIYYKTLLVCSYKSLSSIEDHGLLLKSISTSDLLNGIFDIFQCLPDIKTDLLLLKYVIRTSLIFTKGSNFENINDLASIAKDIMEDEECMLEEEDVDLQMYAFELMSHCVKAEPNYLLPTLSWGNATIIEQTDLNQLRVRNLTRNEAFCKFITQHQNLVFFYLEKMYTLECRESKCFIKNSDLH